MSTKHANYCSHLPNDFTIAAYVYCNGHDTLPASAATVKCQAGHSTWTPLVRAFKVSLNNVRQNLQSAGGLVLDAAQPGLTDRWAVADDMFSGHTQLLILLWNLSNLIQDSRIDTEAFHKLDGQETQRVFNWLSKPQVSWLLSLWAHLANLFAFSSGISISPCLSR